MPYIKRYADHTRYPEIYSCSYWGSFVGKPHDDIIKSRNKFVEERHIVSPKRLTSGQYRNNYLQGLDHQEFYEDSLGRIIHVYSQHQVSPLFTPMSPIYNKGQVSGYRAVETRKSKNRLLKRLFQPLPDDVVNIINSFMIQTKAKVYFSVPCVPNTLGSQRASTVTSQVTWQ